LESEPILPLECVYFIIERIIMISRRNYLSYIGSAALMGLFPNMTFAQGKPLKILVGYPAGGAVDVVARQLGEELRAAGYNAVVENRTGAAGQLATEAMLAAPADGSTIVMMPGGNATIFPHVYPKLRYAMSDLAPLASVCSFQFGLGVGPGTPAKTLKEFVDWAKANPGKASYGTPGAGTAMHFMGVMFGRKAGIDFQHVPYRGGALAMTDVLGGTIPSLTTTLPNLVTQHKAGKLRILGFSGDKALPGLPGVPTFKEQGYPELQLTEVFAVFASSKTPKAVHAELEKAILAAARSPRLIAAIEKLEFDTDVRPSADLARHLQDDFERWGPIIKATGYTAEN
jgi:tripartite-type tricarboxylate transporter receptor subunit TctC